MDQKEFEIFVNQGKRTLSEDIEKEVTLWKDNVELLYQSISKWLYAFVEKKQIIISRNEIILKEELTGEYLIDELELIFNGNVIKVRPYGTYVVGCNGRVDLIGPRGQAMIGLCDEKLDKPNIIIREIAPNEKGSEKKEQNYPKVNWVWKWITPPPSVRFITLTKELFFDLFVRVING